MCLYSFSSHLPSSPKPGGNNFNKESVKSVAFRTSHPHVCTPYALPNRIVRFGQQCDRANQRICRSALFPRWKYCTRYLVCMYRKAGALSRLATATKRQCRLASSQSASLEVVHTVTVHIWIHHSREPRVSDNVQQRGATWSTQGPTLDRLDADPRAAVLWMVNPAIFGIASTVSTLGRHQTPERSGR